MSGLSLVRTRLGDGQDPNARLTKSPTGARFNHWYKTIYGALCKTGLAAPDMGDSQLALGGYAGGRRGTQDLRCRARRGWGITTRQPVSDENDRLEIVNAVEARTPLVQSPDHTWCTYLNVCTSTAPVRGQREATRLLAVDCNCVCSDRRWIALSVVPSIVKVLGCSEGPCYLFLFSWLQLRGNVVIVARVLVSLREVTILLS